VDLACRIRELRELRWHRAREHAPHTTLSRSRGRLAALAATGALAASTLASLSLPVRGGGSYDGATIRTRRRTRRPARRISTARAPLQQLERQQPRTLAAPPSATADSSAATSLSGR
jgi:hypothetical protein